MIIQHPLYPLIFAVILAAIIVKQCIVRHKFLKNRLVLSFILIFALVMCCVFYENIKKSEVFFQILNYTLIGVDILIAVFFFLNIDISLSREHFQREIVRSLDETEYFLFINKKGKVVEMSHLFAEKFNIDKSEVLGNNIRDILDENITIESVNGNKVSNKEFFDYLIGEKPTKDSQDLKVKFLREDKTEDEIDCIETPIYVLDKYSGRMYLSRNTNQTEVVNVKSEEDTLLEERFQAILEESQEGIFIADLEKKNVWCNDYLVENLALLGNTVSLNDYYLMLNKDDYNKYQQTLSYATPENPNYKVSYRFFNDNKTMIVKEEGKVLFDGRKPIEIIASLKAFYNRGHMKTNIGLLDSLEDENHLYAFLSKLGENRDSSLFEVVYLRLDNIPEINEKYGRPIGNMVIEEYVASLQKAFADNEGFYRISGLDFVFVITDIRKMEQFRKVLLKKNILTPELSIGSVNLAMNVYMGISFAEDAIRPKDIYLNAKTALNKALDDKKHFCFYRDIK